MKIKICGLRDNVEEVIGLRPDYIGFIFFPGSKRFVGIGFNPNLPEITAKKTGVFVNQEPENILETVKRYQLDAVQLHGDESPDYCARLYGRGFEVIKAFGIDEQFEFSSLDAYVKCCDYFLFDTKSREYGGTGTKFNWTVLGKYKLNKPYFLSGGIGAEDIGEIKSLNDPRIYAVDINSRVEIKPGLKAIGKIRAIQLQLNNK